ncbi:MAG: helix-turn-helix transcriptional regulator [Clostridia bacterium]|nr:helix-turn-helix transcriptional regulator [Clostridia bacterium]
MKQILSYNPFTFRLLSFVTSKATDNSRGTDCHFFGKLRKGSGTLTTLSGEVLHLSAGDIFYIPIGLRYCSDWRTDHDGFLEWESYAFFSFPPSVDKQYSLQKILPTKEITEYLNTIAYGDSTSAKSIGFFYLFMSEALSLMTEKNPDLAKATVEKAKKYISRHPDFKVSELARHCNMSESGLFSLFKNQGLTPIELKHRILVEKAVTLLCSTDLSVEQISDRLGFSDPGYFRKIFRRYTDKTPMEVRREHQSSIAL